MMVNARCLVLLVAALPSCLLCVQGFATSMVLRWHTPSVSSFRAAPLVVKASSSSAHAHESCAATEYIAQHNETVTFPLSYAELMVLEPGAFVASDILTVRTDEGENYDFCVKLYPRGSRAKNPAQRQKSGFGMSYAVSPIFGNRQDERVGVYLQFLPKTPEQTVDASFALRLLGKQSNGPRFDVEWRSGMRFVSLANSKVAKGRANDFGAHIMQTALLANFLGITDSNYFENKEPIQLQVEIIVHGTPPQEKETSASQLDATSDNDSVRRGGFSLFPLRDIRATPENNNDVNINSLTAHDTNEVRVGRVVTPVLRKLSERPSMFAKGVYPGVEYRILRIVDPATGKDLFYSKPGADYELKPIYPLVQQLERPWPVRVNERDIPKLYTPGMYNAISAIVSLFTAITGLFAAFVISQAVSLFYIPSRSMDPTLEVGDVLLVEKVSPRLLGGYHTGDVVLFSPPQQLRDIVSKSGGRITSRDLFVKRIAAEPGDWVSVEPSGAVKINGQAPDGRRDLCTAEPLGLIKKYLNTQETLVLPGTLEVLGDCSSVSIDSRVWGPLPNENIVGRPIVRLWPLSKFGPVPSLPTAAAGAAELTTEWKD